MTVEDWIKQEQGKHFCHCGCGNEIILNRHHHSHGIPNYIQGHNVKGRIHSEATRQKISDVQKCKKRYFSDEHRQKLSAARKGMTFSDEHKRNLSKAKRGEKHPNYGKKQSDESKKKMSLSSMGKKMSIEARKKMSDAQMGEKNNNYGKTFSKAHRDKIGSAQIGNKNHAWRGGISYGKYCHKFSRRLKNDIREKFDNKCLLCGKNEIDNGRKLDIHHVDYNKNQGCLDTKWKLVALCRSCHSKTNSNREYWESIISHKLNIME